MSLDLFTDEEVEKLISYYSAGSFSDGSIESTGIVIRPIDFKAALNAAVEMKIGMQIGIVKEDGVHWEKEFIESCNTETPIYRLNTTKK